MARHFVPWGRRTLFVIGACTALVTVLGLGAQETGKKAPVPPKAARAEIEQLVDEIFKADLAKAADNAAKAKIAAELFQQGKDSKDELTVRYVLLQRARELASTAGDYLLALQAIDELGRGFDVPVVEMKAQALVAAAPGVIEPEANKAFLDLLFNAINEAVDQDQYAAAVQLTKSAETAAKKTREVALITVAQKRAEEILTVQQGYTRIQPFLERVKGKPDDPEANRELGLYYGLLRGKWDKALPFLARGNDETLKALARKDLGQPKEAQEQLALADGWWQQANGVKEPARLHLQQRAAFWYERAVQGLAGLNRTKAARRVDLVAARTQGPIVIIPGPVGLIRTLDGHTGEVKSVAFSPDGRFGLSGGLDDTMRLWDLKTGKEVRTFRGHTKQVWSVAYLPSGRQVLSASWDSTVKLWDALTGRELKTFRHPIDVNGITVSRDGRWLLSGCDDQQARLWDLTTGQEVIRYSGHTGYVYGVAFSPDGRTIASGSQDRTVILHDRASGQRIREMSGQSDPTICVAYSPDSRYVFSCGDNAAHQWEVETGKEVRRFETPVAGRVNAMALSPDGRRLLTGHDDRSVRLWDVTTGKELHRFDGHTSSVSCVTFSPDGRRALSGGLDQSVRLWGLPAR